MAGEHLVMGTVGTITTEEAGTVMKTGMTDEMMDHGAPEIFTLGIFIGMMIEGPTLLPFTQDPTESKGLQYS